MVQAPLDKLPSQVEAEQIGPDENHEGDEAVLFFLRSYQLEESVFQFRLEGSEKEGEPSFFFLGLISFGHGPNSDIMNDNGNQRLREDYTTFGDGNKGWGRNLPG